MFLLYLLWFSLLGLIGVLFSSKLAMGNGSFLNDQVHVCMCTHTHKRILNGYCILFNRMGSLQSEHACRCRTALHHILTIQCQASECRCRRFATKVRDCVSRFSTGWPWGKGMKTKIAWMFRGEKEKQKKGDNVWEKAERAHLFSIISISMAHWHLTEIRYTVVVFYFFWGPIILEFGKGSYNMQCMYGFAGR